MKRIAIGIDQPPGRLVDERVVIRRFSRNDREEAEMPNWQFDREMSWRIMVRGGPGGYDAPENQPFDPVGRRGELLNDLVMVYGDECGYHSEDNGDHIIP
jgi:hypothetical protein